MLMDCQHMGTTLHYISRWRDNQVVQLFTITHDNVLFPLHLLFLQKFFIALRLINEISAFDLRTVLFNKKKVHGKKKKHILKQCNFDKLLYFLKHDQTSDLKM